MTASRQERHKARTAGGATGSLGQTLQERGVDTEPVTVYRCDDAVVEQVAQAIHLDDGTESGGAVVCVPWEDEPEKYREEYRSNARAAVSAFLKATGEQEQEMREEVALAWRLLDSVEANHDAATVQSHIDLALERLRAALVLTAQVPQDQPNQEDE